MTVKRRPASVKLVDRYGKGWPYQDQYDALSNDLIIEQNCIRYGTGPDQGTHYEAMRRILWPELHDHRWHRLIRDTMLEQKCTVLAGPASTGKAQPLDATVFCPKGPKKMGQMKVGDHVCTPSQSVATVTGVFPQGVQDVYRIIFKDGGTVEASGDHLWKVDHLGNGWKGKVLTTLQIMAQLEHDKRPYKVAVLRPKPVQFHPRSVLIDPYLLGVLIGDGALSNSNICVSTSDRHILDQVEDRIPDGLCLKKCSGKYDYRIVKSSGCRVDPNDLLDNLRQYKLWGLKSDEKFIPEQYLFNSQHVRMELIRGLMDTDGTVGNQGGISFTTTSQKLSEQFRILVESIGGVCSITSRKSCYTYSDEERVGKLSYTCFVEIREPRRIFSLPRKRNRVKKRQRGRYHRPIDKIEYVGKKEVQCIAIDHPEKLYLTDHFVPTHNTHEAAWLFLCEYLIFPEDTCVLVSSTDIRGLRGRIWSEITSLWQRAKDRFPWLPGNLLDSRVSILTDALDEESFDRRARDYRKCIQGVPCRNSSGSWIGINRYSGWKQKRMRLIADEAGQMMTEYINGVTNLNSNPDFKVVIMGNFDQPTDCLGRCSEPIDGWSNHMAPRKTEVWDTFYPLKGKCVNLIGFDSPNFDYPADQPDHFPEMLGRKRIEEIKAGFGEDSVQFMSMCWGAMKIATLSHRVLTRELCVKGHAFEEVDWQGTPRTRVAFLDSAWGGDRCVFTWAEFGTASNGHEVFRLNPPEIVPLSKTEGQDADYAIADWCRDRCDTLTIPPENFGHDSTGRGSLGTALARLWSDQCNPVEFGAQPTDRPCGSDLWIYDPATREKRQRTCAENFVKFVSELWFSVRYAVEAEQVRNLSEDVAHEFYMRVWARAKDDKIEVEPKSGTTAKPGMKQRTGRSPDLADSAAGCMEMARRKGFRISKLSNEAMNTKSTQWMRDLRDKHREYDRRGQLVEV